MMDEDRFWKLIAQARQGARKHNFANGDEFLRLQMDELADLLRNRSLEEIIAFDTRFSHCLRLAYRWDIWGAVYWICGGCSDDSFLDFRSTLVSLGHDRFYQVLADPEVLADLVDQPDVPSLKTEGFQYIPSNIYEEKTGGQTIPLPMGSIIGPYEPTGQDFDFDDVEVMRQRYPKLTAKFPDD